KAAMRHKIPDGVGGNAEVRRRSVSWERKRKKRIIFWQPFIIEDKVNARLVLWGIQMIFGSF
ncbi:hypothetical protein J4Z10_12775, partial [Escherichia coli]